MFQSGSKLKPGERLARRPLQRIGMRISDTWAVWKQALQPANGFDGQARVSYVAFAIADVIDDFLCSVKGRLILCAICLEAAWIILH